MKDKQFLEHLNLYLDGEIDPAGAAALEQEILANPARRRIYNDYCRIHRATQLVGRQFHTPGITNPADALPPARQRASTKAASFTSGGRTGGRATPGPFRRLAFASGLAAACAVGVFIGARVLAPRAAEPVAPAPAVAVSESPAAAPLVAAAPAAVAQPATFAAPFAPEMRPDPFVQPAPARNDPFALTPWTMFDEASRSTPPSIANQPALRIDPRFRPVSLENWTVPQGTRETGPFRLRVNTPAATSAPDEMGAQR